MSKREPIHVIASPLDGDVIEVVESIVDTETTEAFDRESMLRVVICREGMVWYKEYGKGHRLETIIKWRHRLNTALRLTLIRGADHDAPF